jgi:Glycoside hydrolase 123, catalytic domain/Glycoside hydrolase 123 N-terminal domain
MKHKFLFPLVFCLISQLTVAQDNLESHWGSTDSRYKQAEKTRLASPSVLELTAWRGERVNAQFVLCNGGESELETKFTLSDLTEKGNRVISRDHISAGYVETVITDEFSACGRHEVDRYGSYAVADMIDNKASRIFAPAEARGVWMSIQIPREAEAGVYKGNVVVESSPGTSRLLNYSIKVLDRVLPSPDTWTFHLDFWQNPYALARIHQVDLWSEEHFNAMRPSMEMLASAGQKVITATMIDKPWNGQTLDPFGSMITWIKKADGQWMYDFTIFDMWVEFMMDCGIAREIACYSMIPWNLSFQYFDQASNSNKYIQSAPGEELYNEHWGSMLEVFVAHLKDKGWFDITCIAMDERALDQMQKGISLIHEKAPGLKISLAGNYHPEIEKDLYDYSVDEQSEKQFSSSVVERRRAEGKKSTYYTCCSTHRPNTFTFSPPAEAEFLGWYAIRKGLDGYLRWAYNSWTEDPVSDSRFTAWSGGDTYIVYPEARSSVRWERLIEGIQAFEKYHILRKEAIRTDNKSRLSKLDAIVELIDPKNLEEGADKMINEARKLLNRL